MSINTAKIDVTVDDGKLGENGNIAHPRLDHKVTHLLSSFMVLSAWDMSWETPENKSNSLEYRSVMFLTYVG